MSKFKGIIKGQEAICPDGLGRVEAYSVTGDWIKVATYIDNRGCKWAPYNVELISPRVATEDRS